MVDISNTPYQETAPCTQSGTVALVISSGLLSGLPEAPARVGAGLCEGGREAHQPGREAAAEMMRAGGPEPHSPFGAPLAGAAFPIQRLVPQSTPIFSGTLAAVRRHIWHEQGLLISELHGDAAKPQSALRNTLVYTLCHAA
jgi:hypothetical protein